MIGKTNVGGGGSNFVAYIAVATDPNALISAVNLAGDVFTGTANSSGSLVLTVRNPGTYTLSETGGGTGSVVVSDYGVTYSVSVYYFGGYFIRNGLFTIYEMDARGIWSGGGGVIANMTITEGVSFSDNDGNYTGVELETQSGNTSQCCLVATQPIDLTDYSSLKMAAMRTDTSTFGVGIFTREVISDDYVVATLVAGTSLSAYYNRLLDVSVDISAYNSEFYVGAYIGRGASPSTIDFYIKDLYLE